MRKERTQDESAALEAIRQYLHLAGHSVGPLDPAIVDRPDALMEIDGARVAIECRTFTPEKLLALRGLRLEAERVYEVCIPIEPHMWVRQAIDDKSPKVPVYVARSAASSVWLVLHATEGRIGGFPNLTHEFFTNLYRLGATDQDHGFERIYLLATADRPPELIHPLPAGARELLRANFDQQVQALPVAQLDLFALMTATEGSDGMAGFDLDELLRVQAATPILLQPLDKRFRVEYGHTTASHTGYVALNRGQFPFMAIRITPVPPP